MLECPITIVGHPFSSVGMGEQMRSSVSAMRSVGISPAVFDIYRYAARSDDRHVKLVHGSEIDQIPEGGIRIFHLNGNEVDDAIDKIRNFGDFFKKGYNVNVPARSEEHTSELQSLMRRSYDVFCLKNKKTN